MRSSIVPPPLLPRDCCGGGGFQESKKRNDLNFRVMYLVSSIVTGTALLSPSFAMEKKYCFLSYTHLHTLVLLKAQQGQPAISPGEGRL